MNGPWKTITIAAAGQTSTEADLEGEFTWIEIDWPAMTAADISVLKSEKTGGTFKRIGPSTNTAACETGSFYHPLNLMAPAQFVKLYSSNAQAAERTIKVRGV